MTKGTYAKMARGDMVRFLAEENIEEPADIQKYHRLGYIFQSDLSTETEYVFERQQNQEQFKEVDKPHSFTPKRPPRTKRPHQT